MGDSVSTNPVQVHMIGTDCCQNRMITMRKTIYPRAKLFIKKSLSVSTWIYDGQVTFPVFGGVLSMTIVPVAFWVTSPTEFSAHTLIMLGFPVCTFNDVIKKKMYCKSRSYYIYLFKYYFFC